jgi:hypothetical protein
MPKFELLDEIYRNPLGKPEDVADFVLEGDAAVSFPLGRMRLENVRSPEEGQDANYNYWLNKDFPSDIAIEWEFWPIREPGLAMFWFAAEGMNGEDLFDSKLQPRGGRYKHYIYGDINGYHLAYFRRRQPKERVMHLCNLRKSHGFHLVASAADPLPSAAEANPPYAIQLIKCGPHIQFRIRELIVLNWTDDGEHGPPFGGGKIGFRQMAPLMAEYSNLVVRGVKLADSND